jgi:hypothetical protein
MFGKRSKKPRPPLPIDLRIIAAVNVTLGTVFLIVLALGIMIVVAIMLLSLWSEPKEGAATLEVYVILLLEMALLILSGAQIYIRRLLRACITLGIFILPAAYGLIRLPAMGHIGPVVTAIAIVLAYPLVILTYLTFRGRKMRSVSGIEAAGSTADAHTPHSSRDQTEDRP